MNIDKEIFKKVKLIKPKVFFDDRGWFYESYSHKRFSEIGVNDHWLQDNTSFSKMGVIRGLHFQKWPGSQAKLVRCVVGSIWDVVVDIRKDSPTYLHWRAEILSDDNRKMMYIPNGFAHGFLALRDSYVHYKCSSHYNPEYETGFHPFSKKINIEWPNIGYDFFLSEKDTNSYRMD